MRKLGEAEEVGVMVKYNNKKEKQGAHSNLFTIPLHDKSQSNLHPVARYRSSFNRFHWLPYLLL